MPHVFDDVESEVSEVLSELKRRRAERQQAESDREGRLRGVLGGGTPAPGANAQLAAVDQGLLKPFETATTAAQRSQSRGGIAPSVRRVAFDEAGRQPGAGRGRQLIEDELRRQFTEAASTRIREKGILPPPKRSEDERRRNEADRAARREANRADLIAQREAARSPEAREARKDESRRRRGLPPLRRKGESRDDYAKRISGSDQPPERGKGERYADYLKRLDRMGVQSRGVAAAQQKAEGQKQREAEAEAAPGKKAGLDAIKELEPRMPPGMGDALRGYAGLIEPEKFIRIITGVLDDKGLTREEQRAEAVYKFDVELIEFELKEIIKREAALSENPLKDDEAQQQALEDFAAQREDARTRLLEVHSARFAPPSGKEAPSPDLVSPTQIFEQTQGVLRGREQGAITITPSAPKPPGLIEPGNIDLVRPDVEGSTVLSMSFEQDGKEILIPMVVNGKIVDEDAAIAHFRKTGQHLGIFKSAADADRYAATLSQDYEQGRIPQPPTQRAQSTEQAQLFAPNLPPGSWPLETNEKGEQGYYANNLPIPRFVTLQDIYDTLAKHPEITMEDLLRELGIIQ